MKACVGGWHLSPVPGAQCPMCKGTGLRPDPDEARLCRQAAADHTYIKHIQSKALLHWVATGENPPDGGTAAIADLLLEHRQRVFLQLEQSWSLLDVLSKLADAADHLLNDHACDSHGWEGIGIARDRAREIVKKILGSV